MLVLKYTIMKGRIPNIETLVSSIVCYGERGAEVEGATPQTSFHDLHIVSQLHNGYI